MNQSKRKIIGALLCLLFISSIFINGCSSTDVNTTKETVDNLVQNQITEVILEEEKLEEDISNEEIPEKEILEEDIQEEALIITDKTSETTDITENKNNAKTIEFNGVLYNILQVDGGDLSGERKPNVAVDIGFGDREYWAFTNEYGQLVYVYANKIILQDDDSEPVNSDGRYYNDEAKVPGVESKDLDEGHVISDGMGGVANAYNITPQNSTLNRHGDQAYMEKVIRDAGGCTDFVAIITYPNTETQIPSHYHYEYILKGEYVVDDFDNVNPDEINKVTSKQESESAVSDNTNTNEKYDISAVDTNGNGKVTIAEAKAAGYKMPIYSDHWLYPYMDDRDGDGMVGE